MLYRIPVRSSAKRIFVRAERRRVRADVVTSDRPPRPDCEVAARAERSIETRRLGPSAQLTGVNEHARNRSYRVSHRAWRLAKTARSQPSVVPRGERGAEAPVLARWPPFLESCVVLVRFSVCCILANSLYVFCIDPFCEGQWPAHKQERSKDQGESR
jgi:hypothetical protein